MADTHKFGVIYQKFGQTCEEELFGNIDHPDSLAEFLDMLGDKVELKGFEGYVHELVCVSSVIKTCNRTSELYYVRISGTVWWPSGVISTEVGFMRLAL